MDRFIIFIIGIVAISLFPVRGYTQKVEMYTDARGNTYASINAKELPRRVEKRSENVNFYVDVPLYKYSATGQDTTRILDEDGKHAYGKRIRRHNYNTPIAGIQSVNYNVSEHFIISPTDVYSDGTTDANRGGTATMDWATANGYLATANSTKPTVQNSATPMGCPMYRGKDGQDEPGTWRVPTQREGALIMVFAKQIEALKDQTDYTPMTSSYSYWLATEHPDFGTNAWYLSLNNNAVRSAGGAAFKNTPTPHLRCIRDVP